MSHVYISVCKSIPMSYICWKVGGDASGSVTASQLECFRLCPECRFLSMWSFTCSSLVYVGVLRVLWFPHTFQEQANIIGSSTLLLREHECVKDRLEAHPGCIPTACSVLRDRLQIHQHHDHDKALRFASFTWQKKNVLLVCLLKYAILVHHSV